MQFLVLSKFCHFKTIFELYLMGYYFVSIRISLKERSLEHFGASEHQVLPRNKNFIEILSYERKGSRDRWKIKKSSKKTMKVTNLLAFKKVWNMFTKQLQWGKKWKKNLKIWINWKTFKIFSSFFIGTNVYKKHKNVNNIDATSKTKWTNKRDYNQL